MVLRRTKGGAQYRGKIRRPVYLAVAVIAALSPNNKWSRNIVNADALIGAFIRGDGLLSVKVSTYNKMKQKAWDILAARPDYDGAKAMLKGQKITSFFMDIMGEFNVTIDGHARNIAYGERVGLTDDRTNIGVREYRALQAAYEEAAGASASCPTSYRRSLGASGGTGTASNNVSACFTILSVPCFTVWGSVEVSCAIVRGRDCRADRIGGETTGPADHRRQPTFLAQLFNWCKSCAMIQSPVTG